MLTLVFAFRSSAALAYAFGMAVITTITITTLLFLYLARVHWRTPLWLVAVGGGVLLLVDLLFLAANLTKLVHGAWLPLLIGLVAFAVMTTWQRGRAVVTRERERAEGSLRAFVDELHERRPPLLEVPGTAIFLNRGKDSAPLAMRANAEHNRVRHQHVVILSIETRPVPRVPDEERIEIDDLGWAGDGIVHVSAHFGYMETPDVPRALGLLDPRQSEGLIDADRASYFLSTIELTKGAAPDDGALAQAAVHRDVLHHGGRRRVLQPAPRPLGDHGVADRGVAVPCARAAAACSASVTATWRRSRSGRRTALVDVSR